LSAEVRAMPMNRKPLVYFERWFDPIAARILGEQDDIELIRLEYATPEPDNWAELSRACGYQVGARTELVEPWFGSAGLLARCPNMLALCSIGAGHDVIDVGACNDAGVIVCNQFGADEFARMKPSAFFINTARGMIHKEDALLDALRGQRIAGAGLDVFDTEPPPADHPLLLLDNVVATPHIAGATVESNRSMSAAAAEQWIALLRGRVPPRLVNPEAWPRYSERFREIIGFRPDPIGDPIRSSEAR
jgi:D-3-phosphoglycerate dehydrogenase / 2-oxoglutarate reductase